MTARQDSRIRLGVASLLISALLFAASVLMRGKTILPNVDPIAWATDAAQKNVYRSWYLAVIAQVLQVFGVLALWAYIARKSSERLAFTGSMMTIAGAVLVMPLFGFCAFIAPTVGRLAQQDNGAATQIASAMFTTPVTLVFLSVSGLLYIVGSLLIAIALWRARVVAKPIAVLYALQAPLLVIEPTHPLQIAGSLALAISAAAIAARVWTDSTSDIASQTPTPSATVTANT